MLECIQLRSIMGTSRSIHIIILNKRVRVIVVIRRAAILFHKGKGGLFWSTSSFHLLEHMSFQEKCQNPAIRYVCLKLTFLLGIFDMQSLPEQRLETLFLLPYLGQEMKMLRQQLRKESSGPS